MNDIWLAARGTLPSLKYTIMYTEVHYNGQPPPPKKKKKNKKNKKQQKTHNIMNLRLL